jgi:2-polyprenyl-6-methoxyphenol hydroxylase-like FAD-dependent oxidoreductase
MYDAIIVGARCAGAPTAMLLARKGYQVLLVDRATFPSDTISTHIIWPHGAEMMDRWGLFDRLAASGCPPVALNLIFDVGPFALKGAVTDTNGGRGGFCPRRTVLDKLLVDAAVDAGAELREGFTAEALVWDGDRVAGIKGHGRTSGTVEERGRVVIGADGVHSLVAKAVRAPKYAVKPPLTTNYYSYYSGFEADDLEEYVRDYHAIGCFPTHEGLTLIERAVAQQHVRRGARRHRGSRQKGA